MSKKSGSLFLLIVVFFFCITLAVFFKAGWPLLIPFSLYFVLRPSGWSLVIMGFTFTAVLRSPWPLLGSVAFALIGKPKRWWPIPAGIAFALVEVFSFYLSEKPLGITRGFTVMGAIIEKLISPSHAETINYWTNYTPIVDWTSALILGVIIGSFISSRYSGEFKFNTVPRLWQQSMGASVARRWIWAFVAGILMGFAARIAGGCVSGMLISGVVQLAPGGFIFMMSLWISGVTATFLFYRGRSIVIKREYE